MLEDARRDSWPATHISGDEIGHNWIEVSGNASVRGKRWHRTVKTKREKKKIATNIFLKKWMAEEWKWEELVPETGLDRFGAAGQSLSMHLVSLISQKKKTNFTSMPLRPSRVNFQLNPGDELIIPDQIPVGGFFPANQPTFLTESTIQRMPRQHIIPRN